MRKHPYHPPGLVDLREQTDMSKGTGEAFVYYIRRGDLIKIGATAHVKVRLRSQAYDELLAVEPGYFILEKQRHRQFAGYKALMGRGQIEWFTPAEALLAHIKALRALHGLPDLSTRMHPRLDEAQQALLASLPPPLVPVPPGTLERFVAKIAVDGECWRRTATLDAKGYGQFSFEGVLRRSHRVSHVMFIGPIPAGLTIDHVKARGCRFKDCVRPAHLEAVTARENTLRGGNMAAIHARTTHCPADHEYTGPNTYFYPDGRRGCRACLQAKGAARYQRLKDDPAFREQRRLSERKRQVRMAADRPPRRITAERPPKVPREPKTHCPAAHPLSDDNVYWRKDGKPGRQCKTCTRDRASAAYWKDREPAPPRTPKPKAAGSKRLPQELRTHCPHGHEYTPDNIYWGGPEKNRRTCKTCARARARAQHETHRIGDGPVAVSYQLAKTHCPKGHPYSGDNLRIGRTGERACIECGRESCRRSRQRKRDREAALLS